MTIEIVMPEWRVCLVAVYAVAFCILFFLPRKFWKFLDDGHELLFGFIILAAPLALLGIVIGRLWLLCHPAPVPYSERGAQQ